jgi:hypothetical protein
LLFSVGKPDLQDGCRSAPSVLGLRIFQRKISLQGF